MVSAKIELLGIQPVFAVIATHLMGAGIDAGDPGVAAEPEPAGVIRQYRVDDISGQALRTCHPAKTHLVALQGHGAHPPQPEAGRADPHIAVLGHMHGIDRIGARSIGRLEHGTNMPCDLEVRTHHHQTGAVGPDPDFAVRRLGNGGRPNVFEQVAGLQAVDLIRGVDPGHATVERAHPNAPLRILEQRHHAGAAQCVGVRTIRRKATQRAVGRVVAQQPARQRADPEPVAPVAQQGHYARIGEVEQARGLRHRPDPHTLMIQAHHAGTDRSHPGFALRTIRKGGDMRAGQPLRRARAKRPASRVPP